MNNMSENEIKNRGLDVLASFIEEVFIGGRMNNTHLLETKKAKQGSSTRPRQAKKIAKNVEKILKDSKKQKNKTKQAQEEIEIQYRPPRYFKNKGKGLKIMTPNQLLTRLPILLAQKQPGNNSQNSTMKSDKLFILCTALKTYQKQSITI